jgi:glycosyltransferase involved in cell wall biosynthesis
VTWTVVGDGPERDVLRERWSAPAAPVAWLGAVANEKVMDIAAEHDVFVLPTRAEGFPISLLEAMAAGLVPVVSDLESGVREAIDHNVHGLLAPIGDVGAFAAAIGALRTDRGRLEAMSRAARARVEDEFDIRPRTAAFQALFARHHEIRRPRPSHVHVPYGSRLDRPWMPNVAVKAVRTVVRRLHGLPV